MMRVPTGSDWLVLVGGFQMPYWVLCCLHLWSFNLKKLKLNNILYSILNLFKYFSIESHKSHPRVAQEWSKSYLWPQKGEKYIMEPCNPTNLGILCGWVSFGMVCSVRPQKISRHFPFVFSFRNADDRHDSMSTATWLLGEKRKKLVKGLLPHAYS